jgi:hypothetical protein
MGDHGLDQLDSAIETVEFKTTLLPSDEGKIEALLQRAPRQPQRRKVYFYDTADLALYGKDLVLRARVTQGEDDDSTVKLRPVDLSDDDAGWREIDGIRIELDVVGAKRVCSAKLEGGPDRGEIEDVEARQRPVASLFTGKQERLVADRAPHGVSLEELEVLGPVDARKWELDDLDGFPYTLAIEEWSLPDATRFIELSFKVSPGEAETARDAFAAFLAGLDVDVGGDQTAKTPRVLKFFADQLPGVGGPRPGP